MVFFNYALRKLNAKIVYYGPGLCGKTTNLQWIHDNFEGGDKGKMVSLATEGDRTIFFDLLPIDIGKIRGMDVTLQLYTVPGQVHYNSTRQLVLRGADGVVFVADSQGAMQSSNTDSLKNLNENLSLQGVNLEEFPHVIQFNKRDLGDLMSIEELDAALNQFDAPFFESVAVEGIGVQETLEGIVRLVMRSLRGRYEAQAAGSDISRLKPAAEGGPWPFPGVAGPTPPTIRPLSVADLAPLPGADSGAGLEHSTDIGAVSFDVDNEPQSPSLEHPPPADLDRPASTPPIEQEPELLEVETSGFESVFDTPADDVGPSVTPESEVIDNLEPVPFEEIDTQTGVLVPSLVAPGLGDFGAKPADLMPQGPGKPFEAEDEAVKVSQYDTADVEELQDSGPDDGGIFGEEIAGEADDVDGVDVAESDFWDEPGTFAEGSPNDQPMISASKPVVGTDIDSLVASVLGSQGMARKPLYEPAQSDVIIPEAIDQAGEIEEETVPFEADPEPKSGQEVVFGDVTGKLFEIDEGPIPADEVNEVFGGAATAVDSEIGAVQSPPHPSYKAPVVFDDSDPFSEAAWEQPAVVEPPLMAGVLVAAEEQVQTPISVSVEDNSLALKLTGTGAIVESGQVRALDIEVPVPGTWVGNRKVTLQLRLTLLPVTEDENDGTINPA